MIRLYKKENCIWCKRAEEFLKERNLPYQTLMYQEDFTRNELINMLPENVISLTLPQIFIDNQWIGGYTDLVKYFEKEKK